ncbi:MAG: serine--tRNA ligase [Candidatus Kerfeldbacteria bacterium]|nr:serine--tRNA ligase [Candidatus Kerfeldbacteria bacterium]
MIDIKFIREHSDLVQQAARNKNVTVDVEAILVLDTKRKELQTEHDTLRVEQRKLGKDGGKELSVKVKSIQKELTTAEEQLQKLLWQVPNIPTEDTPVGKDESENQVVKDWGTKPSFAFKPKPHWELGVSLDLIDNERAAKVAGARFTYLKGDLAIMQNALVQLALTILTKRGFTMVVPPLFIKPDVFEKMARLHPADERYHLPTDDLYLIGSAEHTLGPIHMDEVLPEQQLPKRYAAFSPAFRREAGAAGKDTRGILRLHQFDKIEMEVFSTAEQAITEHLGLVAIEEEILQALELPYQLLLKCTGDIGDPNARGMDINTWMPGQDLYRETHTADYMSDYQARRLNTKVKRADGSTGFVHMNDATAIAIGRTLAAIMENYQQADGSITVPKVLQPWMFGVTEIKH